MNLPLLDIREEYLAQTLRMMIWIRRGLIFLTLVQGIFILAANMSGLIVNALLTTAFIGVATALIYFCRRAQVHAAALTMLLSLLCGSVIALWISSNTLVIIAIYPAMACAAIAPYTRRKLLLRMSIAAMLSFALLSAWKLILPLRLDANWFDCVQLYLGLNLTVGISVALIWLAHDRLSKLFLRFVAANKELTTIKATLECQVQERTRESARSVEMLRATLEATADGIVLTDPHNTPIIWNQKYTEMWQVSDQFISNADLADRLRYISDQVEQPQAFLARLNAIWATPDAISLDTLVLRDGRVFERYSQPQLLEGYGASRVWSLRDITQRVRAEQRANAFAALGLELSATVSVEDAARTILAVAEDLLGWDACYLDFYNPNDQSLETIICYDTIGGTRTEMPLPPASTLSFEDHRILRGGAQLVLREPTDPDLGELVPFGNTDRPSASLMFVPIHRGTATIGVLSIQSYSYNAYTQADLATFQSLANHCAGALDRNRSEAALRRAEEERQQFERQMLETQKLESLGVLAGGIAHDFNNLLAVILGNTNMAQIEIGSTHPATHSLHQIEIAARRAADLTRQMLAYTGKGQFVIQRIDINSLMSEMSELLSASMPKHVRFTYQFAPDLPRIEGDATQLRQVCMNVLVNAAEAIGESDGIVSVRTFMVEIARTEPATNLLGSDLQAGAYLAIEVRDSGCGMDAAMVQKIFEPFFSTKFTGRGLGLAAVLGIVRSHKGAVRVISRPAEGTTFQILLPPAQVAQEPLAVHAAGPHQPWRGRGTILVVDDEPAIRRLISRMLEQSGFTALLASDGIEALERFQEHAHDLTAVLLDLTMPHMHGYHVLQHMHDFNPRVPVILMSGYTEQDAFRFDETDRGSAFLHKPFRLDELQAMLQQLLPEPETAPRFGNNGHI